MSRRAGKTGRELKRQGKVNATHRTPISSKKNVGYFKDTESQWSARTVVSIKFSDKDVRSKKSLRSQQSILLESSRFMVKRSKETFRRFATKTFLKFTERGN